MEIPKLENGIVLQQHSSELLLLAGRRPAGSSVANR